MQRKKGARLLATVAAVAMFAAACGSDDPEPEATETDAGGAYRLWLQDGAYRFQAAAAGYVAEGRCWIP